MKQNLKAGNVGENTIFDKKSELESQISKLENDSVILDQHLNHDQIKLLKTSLEQEKSTLNSLTGNGND